MSDFWLLRALNTRLRVIQSFIVREFKQHRAGARLGFLFYILEVIAAMMVLALLFSIIGRQSVFGDSIMLFMLTGIAPFLAFMRLSSQIGGVAQMGSQYGRSPLLTVTGFSVSHTLATLVATPLAMGVVCGSLYMLGVISAIPQRLEFLLASLLLAVSIGFGVGLFNAVIGFYVPPWRAIYELMTRGLFFLSGIFYVPDHLPPAMRDVLAWNPLVHVVALSRQAFYDTYPTDIMSYQYVFGWAIGSLFVGLWAERIFRRGMLV
ncbi:MAG: ABC transporter permease [Rhodobacteraceae bacterium]|nr:ABC transporter permease [Paracoccaceae bacterium]